MGAKEVLNIKIDDPIYYSKNILGYASEYKSSECANEYACYRLAKNLVIQYRKTEAFKDELVNIRIDPRLTDIRVTVDTDGKF